MPPLYTIKFRVSSFRYQDKKLELIRVYEDFTLERSSDFMRTYYDSKIVVQTTGDDDLSINGKS